jgi:hypothetical protein
MRVAFDIGGVISKYPGEFRSLIMDINRGGGTVFVISDMHPRERIIEVLRMNRFIDEDDGRFGLIREENVVSADYNEHGEACKAVLLEQLGIHMFFDDFIGYVTPTLGAHRTIRLLVMPDHEKPYYDETWKMPEGEPTFGRRTYSKKQMKGRDA